MSHYFQTLVRMHLQDCDHWTKGNTWVKPYEFPSLLPRGSNQAADHEVSDDPTSWETRNLGSGRPRQSSWKNSTMQTKAKNSRSLNGVPLSLIIVWAHMIWNPMKLGKNNFPWKHNSYGTIRWTFPRAHNGTEVIYISSSQRVETWLIKKGIQ